MCKDKCFADFSQWLACLGSLQLRALFDGSMDQQ
jgi:hypothetical protein